MLRRFSRFQGRDIVCQLLENQFRPKVYLESTGSDCTGSDGVISVVHYYCESINHM
jgi:hypothetical protein